MHKGVWVLMVMSLSGCSYSLEWWDNYRAHRALKQQDLPSAVSMFRKMVDDNPQSDAALSAARTGARVAHLEAKDYRAAVEFYRHIILVSVDADERKNAQRFIAQIFFDNLRDFDQAVVEYEKLLKLAPRENEAFRYRLNLAKAHLQLNNLEQAENEINQLLSDSKNPDAIFEAKVLRANLLVSSRKLSEAAEQWTQVLKEFPDRSRKDKVALNLVVCYEEMKDFPRAIQVLQGMKVDYPNPDFLELRMERLRQRMSNQPGAQGLRR